MYVKESKEDELSAKPFAEAGREFADGTTMHGFRFVLGSTALLLLIRRFDLMLQ